MEDGWQAPYVMENIFSGSGGSEKRVFGIWFLLEF
jgi:hypothetical protein